MDADYASSFVKARVLPENLRQAVISLNEVGSANYVGLAPQLKKETKKTERKRKKPKLLPQFRGQTSKQLKKLLRREQSADSRRDMTCPKALPRRLSELWSTYARSLVDWAGVAAGASAESRLDQVLRMDLIGARLRVLRSIATRQADLEGIVVMETRHVFYLATEDVDTTTARLHIVPKRGAVFLLLMPGAEVALNGSSLAYRPMERTLRKWKLNTSVLMRKRKVGIYTDLFSDFVFLATDPANVQQNK